MTEVANSADATGAWDAIAACRATEGSAGEVRAECGSKGSAAGELGDGAGDGRGRELGAVKAESGLRAGVAAGADEAADRGVEVSRRVPFGTAGSFLLAQPCGGMNWLAGVASADDDGLEFGVERPRGRRELGAQQLGRHSRVADQVHA